MLLYGVTITQESRVCINKEFNDNFENWRLMATVSDYLGVSSETVLQWIEKKGMPAHKVGRHWKV